MIEYDKEKEARIIKRAQEQLKAGLNFSQISKMFGVEEAWLKEHVPVKKPKKPGWFGDPLEDEPPKKSHKK